MLEPIFVNINGKITDQKNAQISVFDRGFLFGDSIYEVTYTEDGCILFLDEHLDRLETSANFIDFNYSFTREFLISEILKTLKTLNMPKAYIRLIITRGESSISLDPTQQTSPNFIIIVKALPEHPIHHYTKGLHLTISSIERNSIKSTNPRAKSGNYLNNVMALNDAKKRNADDAIMINSQGQITEGTTFNVWMIKNNKVYTPSLESGLLKGITRDKVLEICNKNKIKFEETTLRDKDFLNADEMFITSSTRGIMPIYKLDNKVYGDSIDQWPMTQKLIGHYITLKDKYKNHKRYCYL